MILLFISNSSVAHLFIKKFDNCHKRANVSLLSRKTKCDIDNKLARRHTHTHRACVAHIHTRFSCLLKCTHWFACSFSSLPSKDESQRSSGVPGFPYTLIILDSRSFLVQLHLLPLSSCAALHATRSRDCSSLTPCSLPQLLRLLSLMSPQWVLLCTSCLKPHFLSFLLFYFLWFLYTTVHIILHCLSHYNRNSMKVGISLYFLIAIISVFVLQASRILTVRYYLLNQLMNKWMNHSN